MYAENFRISRNVCLFFIFGKFSKPMRADDVERKFFLGWPKSSETSTNQSDVIIQSDSDT
jgi:hypothetical protein